MSRSLHLLVMVVGLFAPFAPAEPVAISSDDLRLEYEKRWSSDQKLLESSIRSLHEKFAANLERVREDAQSRGDLDETLASKELIAKVMELSSGTVFRVGGGVQQQYVLPDPPSQGNYTRSGYTAYVARIEGLLDTYNAAASNRYQQFLVALDDRVREATKRDALDIALKIRGEREARIAQGAPRMTLAGRPTKMLVEVPSGGFSHPILGLWALPNGHRRQFNADRTVDILDQNGPRSEKGEIMPINERRVDVRYSNEFIDKCVMEDDDTVMVFSRQRNRELTRYRMQRVAPEASAESPEMDEGRSTAEPAPAETPDTTDVQRVPAAKKQTDRFTGRWIFEKDVYQTREFLSDGTVRYVRKADGTVGKEGRYYKLDEKEAEVPGKDGWIDSYTLNADGSLTLKARHSSGSVFESIGRRDKQP